MKIAIVGTGYVGLVTGTCFAEIGVNVTCVDTNSEKIESLQKGMIPIYENGLEEMVLRNVKAKRLKFTTSLESCLDDVEVIFSAVGTPPDEDGSADLSYVLEVARTIGRNMNQYKLVVTKSTVPVGTARRVRAAIQEELDKRGVNIEFDVASNPEFLKEGNAISDFMSPDRVVVGVESVRAEKLMSKLYKPFLLNNFRVIFMDIPSAEMTKYAANSMLATRISFMNDIANLCELVGADVNMVRSGIGSDTRIGRKFLYPGIGYGGSCFPKDVKALIKTAEQNGYTMRVLRAVEDVNEAQKGVLFEKLMKQFNGDLRGKTIALWGLAFKPETDDMREAPGLVLIDKLLKAGCQIRAYDPAAMNECKRRIGDVIYYARDMYDAVLDADVLMLITEWKEFRLPSWAVIKKTMNQQIVLDGRNIYDKKEMEELDLFIHALVNKIIRVSLYTKFRQMTKYVAISLVAILLAACNSSKNPHSSSGQEEDLSAKELLQGIWLDDETESPLMRIEGDTIYYADSQSAPITFKIIRDTLYTYGNDTTYYKIDKQGEHIFWFHSIADNMIRLHKSEDPNDSLSFVGQEMIIPTYTEVTKRDSIVNYNGSRYRAYVYINPSKMRVIKTIYTEDGISMDNVYYDNVMHICVYEGKKSLFASDITKQMFESVVPADFLVQAILSDTKFVKVDRNGFHYQAVLSIPESSIYSIANLTVSFSGKLTITPTK